MRIVRDIGFVKRRRKLGRLAALVGFLMLGSTFAFIFFPHFVYIAYVFLVIGFLAFNFGMQQMAKWSNSPQHPRNDLAIDDRLSNLSDRYAVLHYVRAGKFVIEHMLLYPGGIVIFTTKDVPGIIIGEGARWRRKKGAALRLIGMGGPQLGNPTRETAVAIEAVKRRLEEAQFEVDVSGIILFTAHNAEIEAEETEYPAITMADLAEFARLIEVDPTFKPADRDRLISLFAEGQDLERNERVTTRRPVKVKRRAVSKSG